MQSDSWIFCHRGARYFYWLKQIAVRDLRFLEMRFSKYRNHRRNMTSMAVRSLQQQKWRLLIRMLHLCGTMDHRLVHFIIFQATNMGPVDFKNHSTFYPTIIHKYFFCLDVFVYHNLSWRSRNSHVILSRIGNKSMKIK